MSIILAMIVRNESHVIRRCLESVKPFVDAWVIADTGSTDETIAIIEEVMADLLGGVVQREWRDFAWNRNEVLDVAFSEYGHPYDPTGPHYVLTIDADETLVFEPETLQLSADGYNLPVEYAGTRYQRLALLRLDAPWRYVGPVHEYLEGGGEVGTLTAPMIQVHHEGARSRDPETYLKDAALLEEHVMIDPNPRWQFYLAQSYRDAGDVDRARVAYAIRAIDYSGWEEERWFATFQFAKLTGGTDDYLRAYNENSLRAEPLVELATKERLAGRYASALIYANAALDIEKPSPDALFVDESCYGWRRWDEVALASYYCGEYVDALTAARYALACAPDDVRLQENLRLCEQVQG